MKDPNTAINAAILVHHHALRVLLESNPQAMQRLRLERDLLSNAMLYQDTDDELQEAMQRQWTHLLDQPTPGPPEPG